MERPLSSPEEMHPPFHRARVVRDPGQGPLVTDIRLQSPAVVDYGHFSSRF
jgi:hypothetical protein